MIISKNKPFMQYNTAKIVFPIFLLSLLQSVKSDSFVSPLQIPVETAVFPAEESSFAIPSADLRLPIVLVPSHYKIDSRPILDVIEGEEQFTAPGVVTITAKCVASSRNITLHAHNSLITIHKDRVKVRSNGVEVPINWQYFIPEKDFYIIELAYDLIFGNEYVLEIPHTTVLSQDDWVGHYRAYYVNPETGKTHYMSTTKFEPYHARKAFPCFDEPQLKAVFEVSLARLSPYHSLSNVVIRESKEDPNLPGWTWDHYQPSEIMATYLVCMIVSDFGFIDADSNLYTKPVKTWAPPHLTAGGHFAANTVAKVLNRYETLFGMEYALPKMDSIFIPQFPSGAMENWGLNTYLEALLMYYDGVSMEANRFQVAQVLAHELTHQWFGNLVTCKWWSDIWLNEGFASYWMYYGVEAAVPESDSHNRFYIDSLLGALSFDEGLTTHPIHNSAETPQEISAVFDSVSYHKAGSVLRMVENIFGREAFHQALQSYLSGMQYSNAEQDDLFGYLDSIKDVLPEDLSIKEVLDSWTLQSGHPLVRINKITDNMFFVSQEKFGQNRADSQSESYWHVPISVISGANPDFANKKPRLWLRNNQLSAAFKIETNEINQWLIFNADSTGFYRVLYDEALFTRIETQLMSNANVISSLTRSQLIDNYFNFASAGYVKIEQALRLTKYLGQETNFSPWTLVTNNLRGVWNKLSGTTDATVFMEYLLPKVTGALDLLGHEQELGENGTNIITRAMLLDWACAFGEAHCLQYADKLYNTWKDAGEGAKNPIPTDIQSVMYCGSVRYSTVDAFDFFYKKYQLEANPTLKARLLNALACSDESTVVEMLLSDAITPGSGVADADRALLIQKIAVQPQVRSRALEFINNNLGTKLLTPAMYASVITALGPFVSLNEQIAKIEQDINAKGDLLDAVRPTLNAATATMKLNSEWLSTVGSDMIRWLEVNKL